MPTLDAHPLASQQQQQQNVSQPLRAEALTSSEQHYQNGTARQRHDELRGRRIFVGGLTDDITMEAVLTHFEQFGQIHEVKINLFYKIIQIKYRSSSPKCAKTTHRLF